MRRGISWVFGLAGLAWLAAAAAAAPARPAAIAYDTTIDGAGRVALVSLATGHVTVVTPAPGNELPVWSPDGRRLVDVDGAGIDRSELLLTDLATGRERHVTAGGGLNAYATWSPDGRSIAWTSGRDGNLGIWRMVADGSARRRLATGVRPAWSPDGSRIAYLDLADGSLRVIAAAGGRGRRLPLPVQTDGSSAPSWSPDSRSLAIVGADGSVYRAPADGAPASRLTAGRPAQIAWRPVWAPAGGGIAFIDLAHGGALHVVAHGADRVLARRSDALGAPSWSPDGRRLAFADAARQLEVVELAGGARRVLTHGSTVDGDPVWQP
jgi:TolB protein